MIIAVGIELPDIIETLWHLHISFLPFGPHLTGGPADLVYFKQLEGIFDIVFYPNLQLLLILEGAHIDVFGGPLQPLSLKLLFKGILASLDQGSQTGVGLLNTD